MEDVTEKKGPSSKGYGQGYSQRAGGEANCPVGEKKLGRKFGEISQKPGEIRNSWDENWEEKGNIGKLAPADGLGRLATPLSMAVLVATKAACKMIYIHYSSLSSFVLTRWGGGRHLSPVVPTSESCG